MSTPTTAREIWDALLTSQPGPLADDFVEIACSNEELAEDALDKLIAGGASANQLTCIARMSTSARERAWQKLLEVGANTSHLVKICAEVPELQERAWEQLLRRSSMSSNYREIVLRAEGELRQRAWQKLLECEAKTYDFLKICKKVPELAEAAWKKLLELNPSQQQLVELCLSDAGFGVRAWAQLCERTPSAEQLIEIYLSSEILRSATRAQLRKMPEIPEQELVTLCTRAPDPRMRVFAWKRLKKKKPSISTLIRICMMNPEVREDAFAELLTRRPSNIQLSALRKVDELDQRVRKYMHEARELGTQQLMVKLRSLSSN